MDAPRPDAPRLIIKTPQEVKTVQLLEHKVWTIGRNRSNLIRILDRFASRFHGKLEIFEGRLCCYWDLNSSNGSLLNDQRIQSGVILNHGDRITIGSTELLLKHRFVTTASQPQLPVNQQVLMIHASAVQGKIWQEILLSQNIAVEWDCPGTDLQQLVNLRTTTHTLPGLLILDVNAIAGDISALGHWCRTKVIETQILLIDSQRNTIPPEEQSQAKANGFLDLYPAFSPRLLTQRAQFEPPLQTVLKGCGQPLTLNDDSLSKALQALSQLINQTAHSIPHVPHDAELHKVEPHDAEPHKAEPRNAELPELEDDPWDQDPEELTSLQVDSTLER